MESRVGRSKQRYGDNGERLVAGVVPLSADKTKVLVIQSNRRGGWVLPKGGWETDEVSAQDAACREAWEEAGIVCRVQRDLGSIPEMRKPDQVTPQAPKASYRFFDVIVEKEERQWPEMNKRVRQWFSYAEAVSAFQDRPELLEALNRSSIVKK
jgi:diphosphoinositol-polyphosphate diphosphatase